MSWREEAKRKAALRAVEHVKDGFVIGLGSGSTTAYAIQELGRKVSEEGLEVLGVPTSYQAMKLAIECHIPLTSLDEHPQLDISIDGADQINYDLDLIKGHGGAMTREKIVDSSAKQFIVVADETKFVKKLGGKCPVPIEVIPFAASSVMRKIQEIGGKLTVRQGLGKVGPIITDNGNFIFDLNFGIIDDPLELELSLKMIPGIVETGLFVGMTNLVYLGCKTGDVKVLKKS
ncbi:MAG: ribose 5-phosphate isomerase A [Candidatus Bathyarchaeia archaeon]